MSSITEIYDLTVGIDYPVIAMAIWETVLCYLTADDNGAPLWAPGGLFEPLTSDIPDHWQFAVADAISLSGPELWTHWVAMWGYEELVRDLEYLEAGVPGQSRALRVFRREVRRAMS